MAKIKATLIAFQLKDLNQTLISINTNTHHSKSKLTADSKVIYFRCDSFNVSTGAEETRSKYQRFAAVCVCVCGVWKMYSISISGIICSLTAY